MAEQSLRDRTIKGVGWSFAGNAISYGITFVVGIVLARLLTPDEYGLIGIVTVFITVFNALVDSGFSSALIRKTDAAEEDYNTAFFTNLAFSIVLYLVLFLCAPVVASFFDRPKLLTMIRVMGVGLIINAFSSIQHTVLSKRLEFEKKSKAAIVAAFISGIVGIWMAVAGYGVWALVAQQLSKELVYSILLWGIVKWIPSWHWSKHSFSYLWGFGWKMSTSAVIDRVAAQIGSFVIGKCYSPASLGQYSRGEQFASLFSSGLTSVVQQVSYPALSEIQDDKTRLMAAYRKVIKTTMFVTAIGMFALGAVAEPLLFCLIGPQWHDAAMYLPLICIEMSLYPLHAINLNMLQVQGRSDLFLVLEVIKKVLLIPILLVGIFVGIVPMLIVGIFAGILCFFLNAHWSGKLIGYSALMQVKDVAPSYGIAALVAVSVYFLKFLPLSFWIVLPIQIIVGLSVFFCANTVFRMEEYNEIKRLALAYIKPKTN